MKRLILSLILFLVCSPAWADYWNWTPDAKHHAAVVRVTQRNSAYSSSCGSGVLCTEDGIVATAWHVVEDGGEIICEWQSGYKSTAVLDSRNQESDVAFLRVKPPKGAVFIPPVAADVRPAVGDALEYAGYGGPTKRLRHFSGEVVSIEGDSILGSAYLLNGDSGGAVIWNGYLVGTISGGMRYEPKGMGEDGKVWPVHYPALAGLVSCPGGRCYPQWQPRIQYRSQPQQPQIQTAPPISTTPPAPPKSQTDCQESFDKINASIDRLEQSILALQKYCEPKPVDPPKVVPGPAGPQGPAGKDGKDCEIDLDALAAKVAAKIAPAVNQQIISEVEIQIEKQSNSPSVSQPETGKGPAYFEIRPRK